ncbi:MAG: multidrug transporter, partial [Chloroflexi bacterium]
IDMAGAAALMLASISWAVGSLYSRRAALPRLPMVATGIEMIAGGLLQFLAGTALGEWSELDLSGVSLRSGVAMIYLALVGSLIGFSAYVWLLRHTTAARAASYAYVNPVVAVVLGWALLSEELTLRTVLATAIIIGSVVIITSFRAQHPERPRPAKVPTAAASEASAGK